MFFGNGLLKLSNMLDLEGTETTGKLILNYQLLFSYYFFLI